MSELNPEKQRKFKPLSDNCDNCKQDYPITSANSHVYHHAEQTELDHIICECPNCNSNWRIFIDEDTLSNAIHFKLPFTVDKYATDDIHERFLKAQGYEIPPVYDLTPRHEALVAKFGETIMSMPPELFWDNIEAETSRPYTEKWV